MTIEANTNGWREHKLYIVNTLEELKENQKEMLESLNSFKDHVNEKVEKVDNAVNEKINQVDKRLIVMETRATIFGTIAGALVTLVPKLYEWLAK